MPIYPSERWDPGANTTSTIGAGANFIGLATVKAAAGSAYIGLASVNIGGTLPSLSAGTANIGFATVTVSSAPTIFAKVDLSTLIAGEDLTNDVQKVEQRYSYTSFTSLATVLVKSGAGFIHLFNIGKASCPTTLFYDALTPTGTPIHTIGPNYPMGSHLLDITFATGLTIDTKATGGDITPQILVSYR